MTEFVTFLHPSQYPSQNKFAGASATRKIRSILQVTICPQVSFSYPNVVSVFESFARSSHQLFSIVCLVVATHECIPFGVHIYVHSSSVARGSALWIPGF